MPTSQLGRMSSSSRLVAGDQGVAPDHEDSLGKGLDEQMAKFGDVKKAVDEITNVFTTLQQQCTSLRSRQQALDVDCDKRSTEVADLNAQIDRLNAQIDQLTADRDALRIEYSGAREKNAWWTSYDRSHSVAMSSLISGPGPVSRSGSPAAPPALVLEGDIQGKLNRKIWVLEEQVRQLRGEIQEADKRHLEEMEGQLAVSSGLRDRIGDLEAKRRRLKAEKEEVELREREIKEALETSEIARKAFEAALNQEKEDTRTDITKEKEEAEKLRIQLHELNGRKEAAEAELNRMKEDAVQSVKSPPRVLQVRDTNIPPSCTPLTPTKPRLKAFPSLLTSPSTQTVSPKRDASRHSAHLEASYAHLLQTHQSLKAAYDELRDIHKKDIDHMKEYKKSQMTREEARRKKKEEKRARRHGGSISVSISTSAEALVEGNVSSGQTIVPDVAVSEVVVLVEESASLPKDTNGSKDAKRLSDRAQESYHSETDDDNDDYSLPVLPAEPDHTSKQAASTPRTVATPQPRRSEQKRIVQPAHVTPWLGTTPHKGGSSSMNRRLGSTRSRNLDEDEDFASPPDELSTPTVTRTPLVRDRGEATSLRKMVMQKAVHDPVETPIRPSSQRTREGQRGGEGISKPTGTSDEAHTPSTSTGKKRKVADVDMEGLTPHEKAVKRKQIARMPASERRELYKDYKGKGRYLRPEDVNASVREEYEIDPEQNEGAAFAFHDVKRKKSERKVMHGGDCECCKGYYEAVGELPRYNHGPVWRDEPASRNASTVRQEEDAVRDHQNKVSRHRETWTKPPTPPGYWSIGFPSTQDVQAQNERADKMVAEKEAKLRREVAQTDGKWRKKA